MTIFEFLQKSNGRSPLYGRGLGEACHTIQLWNPLFFLLLYMHMSETSKQHFEQAYTTGSDVWTHIPYAAQALSLIRTIPTGSLVLDAGSGRGTWALRLADLGYRVIGIDYVQRAVQKANDEVRARNIADQVRFVEGEVTSIAFTDEGFDLVTDIGLLQHLPTNQWDTYIGEVARVLKSGGIFLNVSLCRDTEKFMGFQPISAASGNFEKYGLDYYFFTPEEIQNLCEDSFEMLEQKTHTYMVGSDQIVLLFSKMQKK